MRWAKYNAGAPYVRAAKPIEKIENHISVNAYDFLMVLKHVAPKSSDDMRVNGIYDSIQNIFDIVDAIREGYTFENGEAPSLDALKDVQQLFNRDDLTADTLIEIPVTTLQRVEEDCIVLAADARLLHARLIPEEVQESRDTGLIENPDGGYAMPQLPPIPNAFWYGASEIERQQFEPDLKPHMSLPSLRQSTSSVLTRSAKDIFENLSHTITNLNQFVLDNRPKVAQTPQRKGFLARVLSQG